MFSLPGNNPSSRVRNINSQDSRTIEEMIIGSLLLLKEKIYPAGSDQQKGNIIKQRNCTKNRSRAIVSNKTNRKTH